ncbi:MAG: hypothetical protein LBJ76_06170, partial [Candidatus Accumulibacter sp.]|nr:hypothetical protein [Accumulibacter sp.]
YFYKTSQLGVLDMDSLEIRTATLSPMNLILAVTTPDPDTMFLIGSFRGLGKEAMLYSLDKRTISSVRLDRLLSERVLYIASVKRNAVIDGAKISLLPEEWSADPPVDINVFIEEREREAQEKIAASAARTIGMQVERLSAIAGTADIEAVGVYEGESASRKPQPRPFLRTAPMMPPVRISRDTPALERAAPSRPSGAVQVRVRRGRPVLLVLSSYEPVHWRIQREPGAKVVAVLRGGYFASEVSGAGDARVYDIGRVYSYKRGDDNYARLDKEVRQWTGKRIDTFQGRHSGKSFEVGGP